MADSSRIIALLEAIGVKRTEMTVPMMEAARAALEPTENLENILRDIRTELVLINERLDGLERVLDAAGREAESVGLQAD